MVTLIAAILANLLYNNHAITRNDGTVSTQPCSAARKEEPEDLAFHVQVRQVGTLNSSAAPPNPFTISFICAENQQRQADRIAGSSHGHRDPTRYTETTDTGTLNHRVEFVSRACRPASRRAAVANMQPTCLPALLGSSSQR